MIRFEVIKTEDEGVGIDLMYVRDRRTGKRLTAGIRPQYAEDLMPRLNEASLLLERYGVEL